MRNELKEHTAHMQTVLPPKYSPKTSHQVNSYAQLQISKHPKASLSKPDDVGPANI